MAFTISDFEDLLRLLGEHPEWRDRLRPVILGDELLEIPSRMDRVEAALDRLEAAVAELVRRMDAFEQRQAGTDTRLDRIDARFDQVDARFDRVDARFDRMDGRMGNIEGELLETRYERQLGSWFSAWLRKPEKISTGELDLFEAEIAGRLSRGEREHVENLDLLVRGVDRSSSSGELLILAVEVSHTINVDDVERAHSRAEMLAKAGYHVRPFAGGYRVTDSAMQLADKLKVIVDVRRPAA